MSDKKVILITGGSGGLGKKLADVFRREHQVIVLANNENQLKLTAEELGVDYVTADITNDEQAANAVNLVLEKYGKIDTLINCAGVWLEGALEDNTAQQTRQAIEVNLLGMINVTRAAVAQMKQHLGGLIINISSRAGEEHQPLKTVYYASKWGVTGFSKSLRDELKPFGVRVTCVMPGPMRTEFFSNAGTDADLSQALDPGELVKMIKYIADLPEQITVPSIRMESTIGSSSGASSKN